MEKPEIRFVLVDKELFDELWMNSSVMYKHMLQPMLLPCVFVEADASYYVSKEYLEVTTT